MKQQLLSLAFTLFSSIIYAQIGIGTTSPDPSSILDIQSTTKGFLAPRINLSSVTNSSIDGANTNAAGLLIYNTNASVTGGSGVGYYYWDGSVWTAMKAAPSGGSGAGWQLDGNNLNGKANDGTTFLGTTTYHSLYFKVDGDQIGRLHPNGGIALGLGASSSVNQAFAIGENASAGNTSNYAFGKGANASAQGSSAYAIGESAVSSQNKSYAIGTSSTASGTSSYAIGEGSKSSATGSYAFGAAANASATGSFAIGNQSVSSSNNTLALGNSSDASGENALALGFNTKASGQNATAIGYKSLADKPNTVILGNTSSDSWERTKVGIGTSDPSSNFHVNGTFRYEDGNEGDGKVLTSDANGNATWQTLSSSGSGSSTSGYGEVYLSSDSTFDLRRYTNLNIANPTAGLSTSDINLVSNGIQPKVSGVYKVTYTVTYIKNTNTGASKLTFYLTKNTNKVSNTEVVGNLDRIYETVVVTKILNLDAYQTYWIGISKTDESPNDGPEITIKANMTNLVIEKL